MLAPLADAWPSISKELASRGFVEGQNLIADVRVGTPDQLRTLAWDLVATRPDVILAVSSALGATGTLTKEIPIVAYGPDPVEQGLAESHARPGGNVTGVAIFNAQLDGKRLELLAEAVPGQRMAVLLSPNTPSAVQSRRSVEAVARHLGVAPLLVEANGPEDYAATFTVLRNTGVKALVITATAWFNRDRDLLGRMAREAGIVTVCEWADMAQSACTMGYGPLRSDLFDRVAHQIARVLQGAHPRDIPIEQPTKFELIINDKAAKSIGATISSSLLARADEVIE
jgi:putative ABC transport system substrate-binding protein